MGPFLRLRGERDRRDMINQLLWKRCSIFVAANLSETILRSMSHPQVGIQTEEYREMKFRKTIIALCGIAAAGLLAPTVASARPGGHGGGGRGAFHGGGGGGGFHGGGFRGAGIAAGAVGLGLGLAAAPYAYGGYGYGPGYDSYAYDDDGGCYLVRRRVMTPYGWRFRRVQVCD
jgi:hypothetical protein